MSLVFGYHPVVFSRQFAIAATIYLPLNVLLMNYVRKPSHLKGQWMAATSNHVLCFTYMKAVVSGGCVVLVGGCGLRQHVDISLCSIQSPINEPLAQRHATCSVSPPTPLANHAGCCVLLGVQYGCWPGLFEFPFECDSTHGQ
jgi:hypothetical protein